MRNDVIVCDYECKWWTHECCVQEREETHEFVWLWNGKGMCVWGKSKSRNMLVEWSKKKLLGDLVQEDMAKKHCKNVKIMRKVASNSMR